MGSLPQIGSSFRQQRNLPTKEEAQKMMEDLTEYLRTFSTEERDGNLPEERNDRGATGVQSNNPPRPSAFAAHVSSDLLLQDSRRYNGGNYIGRNGLMDPVMTIKPSIKLRPFTNEDDYTWTEYKEKIQTIVNQNSLDDEGAKRLITSNMDGDAMRRISARPHLYNLPYLAMLGKLNDIFEVTASTAMHTLTGLKQGPTEHVDSYACRAWVIAQPMLPEKPTSVLVSTNFLGRQEMITNPDYEQQLSYYEGQHKLIEKMVCTWFKNGLRHEIFMKMSNIEFKNFDELRDEAIRAERALLEAGQLIYVGTVAHMGMAFSGTGDKRAEGIKGIINNLRGLPKKGKNGEYNHFQLTSSSRMLAAMDKRGKEGHPNKRDKDGRKGCFDCGSQEHMRGVECPKLHPKKVRHWPNYGFKNIEEYYRSVRNKKQEKLKKGNKPPSNRRNPPRGKPSRRPKNGRFNHMDEEDEDNGNEEDDEEGYDYEDGEMYHQENEESGSDDEESKN